MIDFCVRTFLELHLMSVIKNNCISDNPCQPNPCLNGGNCTIVQTNGTKIDPK